MRNMIMRKKDESPMVTYVKKRLANNLNFLAIFTGPTGVGKTYNALSFSEQLDKDFDAEKHISFDFTEAMNIINDPEFLKKKIKVVLWDEPQIEMSNRAWQSQLNKMINFLLSTFRSQNVILLWASPYKDFLDSQSMKLLHCEFQCLGWDKKTRLSRTKPRLQQYNQDLRKFYPHKLQVIDGSNMSPLFFWDIKEPSKENTKIYERRKREFNLKLNNEILEGLEKMKPKPKEQEKQEIKPLDTRKSLTLRQQMVMESLAHGLSAKDIAKNLNVAQSMIYKYRSGAEKKGYKVSEFIKA